MKGIRLEEKPGKRQQKQSKTAAVWRSCRSAVSNSTASICRWNRHKLHKEFRRLRCNRCGFDTADVVRWCHIIRFCGTVTIRPEILIEYLYDVRFIIRTRTEKVVLVNGHRIVNIVWMRLRQAQEAFGIRAVILIGLYVQGCFRVGFWTGRACRKMKHRICCICMNILCIWIVRSTIREENGTVFGGPVVRPGHIVLCSQ